MPPTCGEHSRKWRSRRSRNSGRRAAGGRTPRRTRRARRIQGTPIVEFPPSRTSVYRNTKRPVRQDLVSEPRRIHCNREPKPSISRGLHIGSWSYDLAPNGCLSGNFSANLPQAGSPVKISGRVVLTQHDGLVARRRSYLGFQTGAGKSSWKGGGLVKYFCSQRGGHA